MICFVALAVLGVLYGISRLNLAPKRERFLYNEINERLRRLK